MELDTIIYSRVSTDDQADYGYGRDHQRDVLKAYCKIKNYGIAKEYLEDHSAKNFNRPEWKKLEIYVKANKKGIKRILFTKWDRFSRNMEEAMRVLRKFRDWGIIVNAVEQPLDLSNPNQKVMLSMYLIMPEIENDNISSRTKDGMYRAIKYGAFLGTPPYGFSRVRYGKYASLAPDEDSELLPSIFNKVSLGVESLEGLRKQFRDKGYKKSKATFYKMLRNRVYIGMVKVPEYRKEDSYWIDGLHDAIIDITTFNKVQDVLEGKNRHAKLPSKKNEALPLRGFLECDNCGNTLTGSVSTGNGGKYGYYHCRSNCKTRVSAISIHNVFKAKILNKIKVSDNVFNLYLEIITDVQKAKRGDKGEHIKSLNQKIQETISLIENTEDKYASDKIKEEPFNRMLNRYNTNLMSLRAELEEVKEAKALSVKTIETAVEMIKIIPQLFENGDFDQKVKILGLLFPEKLIISKNECRTKKQNIVIELLTRVNKGLKKFGTKKAIISDGLSTLAPPLRLELRTL
ncbi:MAG: recombinase family protein [Chlorobi bacterium]|nr:recombinase family protein [Chlorobiota bacterium]